MMSRIRAIAFWVFLPPFLLLRQRLTMLVGRRLAHRARSSSVNATPRRSNAFANISTGRSNRSSYRRCIHCSAGMTSFACNARVLADTHWNAQTSSSEARLYWCQPGARKKAQSVNSPPLIATDSGKGPKNCDSAKLPSLRPWRHPLSSS